MKIYRVGGSVRDELLGLPVTDRDYVVVGATQEALVKWGIDQGLGVFRPVGKDFPVFLHPLTQEEYALARTERSTAPGYRGFAFHAAPDVTLEQDLARRDFTINAMALDAAGTLIDPFGGAADLKARVLRHVGPSFVEDPVRVLRGARFAARFGFAIAPDTMELMREMARNGEVDALVPERVWRELARGLMEPHPVEMFQVLEACAALDKALPELAPFHADAPNMAALRKAASLGLALPVRFAALTGGVDAARLAQLVERVRVPNDCRDLARLYLRHARELAAAATLDAEALAELILGADGLRQEARFAALIAVAHLYCTEADEGMKQGTSRLHAAHAAARAVDAGAIARQHADAQAIAAAVRAARVAAIARAIGMPAA